MRDLLRHVTRALAVALADEQLRRQVYTALHSSPYSEHKLHFGTLLRDGTAPLLAAMATARQADPDFELALRAELTSTAMLATLDSIIDLEFYMPVKEHFTAWDGGANLLVAGRLRDDGTVPYGFNLAGKPVSLDAEDPPATPTLVIVGAETDFTRTAAQLAAQSQGAMFGEGVYMTRAVIYSDHEGWPNGNPEFEVHLYQTDIDDEYIDVHCSGQQQDFPYQWNTEETQDWTGVVQLATDQRLAGGERNQFQMWEDDVGACTPTGGLPPDVQSGDWTNYASWQSTILNVLSVTTPFSIAEIITILNSIPATYNYIQLIQDDDAVGAFSLPCWPPGNGPVNFRILSPNYGHAETGWATLEYRFNFTRSPICPLSVTISGQSFAYAGSVETWTAIPQYGTPPYAYQWYFNGMPAGNEQSFTTQVGGVDFEVSVTVTDAVGATANATMYVTVSGCPPPEITCEE